MQAFLRILIAVSKLLSKTSPLTHPLAAYESAPVTTPFLESGDFLLECNILFTVREAMLLGSDSGITPHMCCSDTWHLPNVNSQLAIATVLLHDKPSPNVNDIQ